MVEPPNPEPPAHDTYRTAQTLSAGQLVLERYTLKKFLGRGGFGVVWLAQDEELDLAVAIKFLSDLIVNNPEAVADLKRETRHSLRLTHPHIVRIHGFIQGPQIAGISMEYVDGGTLSALKAERPQRCYDAEDMADLVTELIDALDYAHTRAQIVHRDLKPGNLMLTAGKELKVADFGISRSISDTHTRLTDAGNTSGTPAYMSPQQMMGQPPRITDDVYSLGATIYDLLAGKPPFYTGDVPAQVLRVTPPSIMQRRTELEIEGGRPIPPEWEATLAACLAKAPENRPANVREVAARLGLAVPSRPLSDARALGAHSMELSGALPGAAGDAGAPTPGGTQAGGALATPLPSVRSVTAGGAAADPATPASAGWTPSAPPEKPKTNLVPLIVVGVVGIAAAAGLAFLRPKPHVEPPAEVHAVAPDGARPPAPTTPSGPPATTPSTGTTPPATTPPASTPPAEAGADSRRAVRLVELQQSIPASLNARRWDQAQKDLKELAGLDPASTELAAWQQQLTAGRQADQAGKLRDAVARAVTARRWDDAARDNDQLLALVPDDPQGAQWRTLIQEGRRAEANPPATPPAATGAPAGAATPPAPTEAAPATTVSDEEQIRTLIAAYARALETLDIGGYAALWRGLSSSERDKLAEAFTQIKSQRVDVSVTGVDLAAEPVVVRGQEKRRVEMKQGTPQAVDLAVRFTVARGPDGRWLIVKREYR